MNTVNSGCFSSLSSILGKQLSPPRGVLILAQQLNLSLRNYMAISSLGECHTFFNVKAVSLYGTLFHVIVNLSKMIKCTQATYNMCINIGMLSSFITLAW